MNYGNGYIIEKASALYSKSSIVLDKCVPIGVKLAVENLNTNAWAGSITANGNPMTCTNCDVGKSTSSIVLDGDNNAGWIAPTDCMNGKKCLLTYPNGDISVDCTTTDCNAEWIGK